MAVGAIIAKIIPWLIKLGHGIAKGAKIAGGTVKLAGKTLVSAGKVGADALKVAYKVATPFANFAKAHPTLVSSLTAFQIGKSYDDIVAAIRHKQLTSMSNMSDEEANKTADEFEEAYKNAATLAEQSPIDWEAISTLSIANPLNAEKPLNGRPQHPTWWFKGSKVSGWTARDRGLETEGLLSNVAVRNLFLNFGHNLRFPTWTNDDIGAGASATNPYTTLLSDDVVEAFYQAYSTFYTRLNLNPPRVKDTVQKDVEHILEWSMIAIASLFEMKRFYDAQEVRIINDEVAGRGMIGIDPLTLEYANAGTTSGAIPKEMRLTGDVWRSASEDGTLNAAVMQAAHLPMQYGALSGYEQHQNKAFPKISNKDWNTMLGRASSVVMSSNMYDFIKYLFEGVFEDNTKENLHEVYVFHAPLISANRTTTNDVPTSAQYHLKTAWNPSTGLKSWAEQYDYAIKAVQRILKYDKAYSRMFALLGLLNSSIPSAPEMNGRNEGQRDIYSKLAADLKRDQMSRTLHIYPADDALYRALYNANYEVVMLDGPYGEANSQAGKVVYAAMANFNKVLIGTRPFIKPGWNGVKDLPTPSSQDAGLIASCTKFRSYLNLTLGPTLIYSRTGTSTAYVPSWYVVAPYSMSFIGNRMNIAATKLVNYNGTPISSLLDTGTVSEIVYTPYVGMTIIPGDVPTSWHLSSVSDKGSNLEINPNITGYDEYDVIELKQILDVQYGNLMLGIQSVRDAVDALSKMDVHFALES